MAEYQEYLDFLYSALAAQNKKSLVLTEEISLVADIGLSSLEVMEFIDRHAQVEGWLGPEPKGWFKVIKFVAVFKVVG